MAMQQQQVVMADFLVNWEMTEKILTGILLNSVLGRSYFQMTAFIFEYDKKQCIVFFNGRGKGSEWKKSFCWDWICNYLCVKSVHIRSFSGPHFSAFELNTERYYPYSIRMRENTDQKNSEYRHFLRSVYFNWFIYFPSQCFINSILCHP